MAVQAGDVIKAQDVINAQFGYLGGTNFSNQLVTDIISYTPTDQQTILGIVSTSGSIIITRNNLLLELKHDMNEGFANIVIDENDTISVSSGYAILSLGV